MKIDFWYENLGMEYVKRIDCFFYPETGIYAGNLYDKFNMPIGDFSGKNSVEIEKSFPGIFGK